MDATTTVEGVGKCTVAYLITVLKLFKKVDGWKEEVPWGCYYVLLYKQQYTVQTTTTHSVVLTCTNELY